MSIGRLAWIIGAGILVLALNVVVSILYIAIYAYLINPGHDQQFYQAYADRAVPYSSIIAGMPLMFLVTWRVGRWWESAFAIKAAILIWLVYVVIDVLALAGAAMSGGVPAGLFVLTAISLLTKLGAAYLGGSLARRRVSSSG